MATKHPKLVKVEEDFERLNKVINAEKKSTKRIDEILKILKLYSLNPHSACSQMYKMYNLRTSIYLESNIIDRLKALIREYSPKVISLTKITKKGATLF
ncbi:hypothetical protein IT402_01790 [Candidatus Nomurabacteria bacterium]|nr:hypothetical protein [Candidatus Nomurabacteria bacterium]